MLRQHFWSFFAICVVFCICSPATNGAKILAIFAHPNFSQHLLVNPYLKALSSRGHEITVIHSSEQKEVIENVRFISVGNENIKNFEFIEDGFSTTHSKWKEAIAVTSYSANISLNVLQNEEVKVLRRSNVTFDLIIIEPSQTEALFGFAQQYNAPLVGLAMLGSDWNTDYLVGYIAPSFYEPIVPIGSRSNLNLWDRLQHLIIISEEWMLMNLILLPKLKEIHKMYFPHFAESFSELRHSLSLLLVNQHFTLGQPRPNVPSIIEIAGMHIPEKLPSLPADLYRFIDEAPHGVIYISLGTEIICNRLPKDTLNTLYNTFKQLKQRVIWKYNITPPTNNNNNNNNNDTKNIYYSDWLPQMGILEHPNVKLFITHGGRLSLIESAYYGVPIIGLPHFFDQFTNVDRIIGMGVGLSLDINKLSEKSLNNAINTILKDGSYTRNALSLSQRFRDQPISPINNAVYWTEYILKYKGAPHMKVAINNFKLLYYYNVDRALVVFLRFGLTALVVSLLCWKFKSFVFNSRRGNIQTETS